MRNKFRYRLPSTACLVTVCLCLSIGVGKAHSSSYIFKAETVVAVGDIHGAYASFEQLLIANGLINDQLEWSAGNTHFVSLGDLLDRGPQSRKVMDLLMRMQTQARVAGGRVHVLLGNHEAMNLVGDLRNVSDAEYAAFAKDISGLEPALANAGLDTVAEKPEGFFQHRAAFSKDGYYGKWLLALPSLIKINDTIFVHGGLSPLVGELGLEGTNSRLTKSLVQHLAIEASSEPLPPILDDPGPLWYRGTAGCHELIESSILAAVLDSLDAQRVVIGHTPTPNRKVTQRLSGRVLAIDTGMLNSVYKGQAFALELTDSRISVLDSQGRRVNQIGLVSAIGKNLGSNTELELSQQLATATPIPDASSAETFGFQDLQGQKHSAKFISVSQKKAKAAEALWRLDRVLGINMVPLTLARKIGNRWGYLDFSRGRWITEAQRQTSKQLRPNFCQEQNDYELLAAFDTLTQGKLRRPQALGYQRGTWSIRLTDQHLSFPRTTKLLKLSHAPKIPELLLVRLQRLSASNLQLSIGSLVGTKEINAILTRRDKLIALIAKETL